MAAAKACPVGCAERTFRLEREVGEDGGAIETDGEQTEGLVRAPGERETPGTEAGERPGEQRCEDEVQQR